MRSGCASRRRGSSGCSSVVSICVTSLGQEVTIYLDHEMKFVAGQNFLSGSAVAAAPPVERGAVLMPPALGYFCFGLRDRIAHPAPLEFGSARLDLAVEGCCPLPPLLAPDDRRPHPARVNGSPVQRLPCGVAHALLRCPQLCEYGLDLLDVVRLPRFALLHGRCLSLSAGLTGLPAAVMTAPTRSVASFSGSRIRWA